MAGAYTGVDELDLMAVRFWQVLEADIGSDQWSLVHPSRRTVSTSHASWNALDAARCERYSAYPLSSDLSPTFVYALRQPSSLTHQHILDCRSARFCSTLRLHATLTTSAKETPSSTHSPYTVSDYILESSPATVSNLMAAQGGEACASRIPTPSNAQARPPWLDHPDLSWTFDNLVIRPQGDRPAPIRKIPTPWMSKETQAQPAQVSSVTAQISKASVGTQGIDPSSTAISAAAKPDTMSSTINNVGAYDEPACCPQDNDLIDRAGETQWNETGSSGFGPSVCAALEKTGADWSVQRGSQGLAGKTCDPTQPDTDISIGQNGDQAQAAPRRNSWTPGDDGTVVSRPHDENEVTPGRARLRSSDGTVTPHGTDAGLAGVQPFPRANPLRSADSASLADQRHILHDGKFDRYQSSASDSEPEEHEYDHISAPRPRSGIDWSYYLPSAQLIKPMLGGGAVGLVGSLAWFLTRHYFTQSAPDSAGSVLDDTQATFGAVLVSDAAARIGDTEYSGSRLDDDTQELDLALCKKTFASVVSAVTKSIFGTRSGPTSEL
jgi:hypothetical protein